MPRIRFAQGDGLAIVHTLAAFYQAKCYFEVANSSHNPVMEYSNNFYHEFVNVLKLCRGGDRAHLFPPELILSELCKFQNNENRIPPNTPPAGKRLSQVLTDYVIRF